MNVVQKVRSIHDDLKAGRGSPADHWALASRLLSRLTNDHGAVEAAVAGKDLAALDAIIARIEGRVAAPDTAPSFSDAELDRALHAFQKRLKVTRLADESKLGGRYTSGGRKSGIDAMAPPSEFPAGVWPALVKAGKLTDMGGGFYGLAGEHHAH